MERILTRRDAARRLMSGAWFRTRFIKHGWAVLSDRDGPSRLLAEKDSINVLHGFPPHSCRNLDKLEIAP